MRRGILTLSLTILTTSSPVLGQLYSPPDSPRATYNFNPGWKLFVGDPAGAETNGFNDSAWMNVTLPHAWNEDDAFRVFISALPTGIAWYRKHFVLPPGSDGKKVFLEFEGLRQGGEFYVNGQWIGRHENGVMAAGFDVSAHVLPYPQENVVAVRTDNSFSYHEVATGSAFQWNSTSFYANYGGINKNVKLHLSGKLYQTLPLFSNLGTVGTYIYAQNLAISNRTATLHAESQVRNEDAVAHTVAYEVVVVDTNGLVLTNFNGGPVTILPGQTNTLAASALVTNLNFWSWGYGYLYNVYTMLKETNTVVDVVRTRTGFRKTQFANGMVKLNDRVIQVKGYAQRSTDEWPAIGQSVPAWLSDFSERLLVDGCGNTVRWMHVTPGKQTVEACDRVGLMQAMPAGDNEGDVTDRRWDQRKELMRDAIIYNRNNPSIVFYESGNENISEAHMGEMKAIRDQYDPFGGRAIGCREVLGSTNAEYGGEMLYIDKSAAKPLWMMEYSRDEGLRKYWDDYSPPYHIDGTGSSYSGTSPANAYNRNQDTHAIEDVVRWFDYYEQRPGTGTRVNAGGVNIVFSDSNTHCRGVQNYRRSGEVDAMRIPKENYFAHQVMWDGWVDVEQPRIHIIGHWSHTNGTVKSVYVVSSTASVELFRNGLSLGFGAKGQGFLFTWTNVAWAAGTLQAVGYSAQGSQLCTDQRVTAGSPAAIRLTPITDPTGWKADGHDLAMIEVEAVDDQGRRCPTALNLISFALSGPAEWRGGIGVRSDTDPADNYILSTNLPVECGVNRVLVRSTTNAGTVTLVASSPGLTPATLNLDTIPFAVTNGLATLLPGEGLLPNYSRGPTPAGPSYQVTRVAVPVAGITDGASSTNLNNTIDDNETTSWTSSSTLSQAWIQFTLARTALVSQVVMKFTLTPRDDSYPLSVQVNGVPVYNGTPPTTLGYVTLDLPPTNGITVRISRTTSGSFTITEAEFYEAVPGGSITPPATPSGLTASAGDALVALTWNPSPGASNYNVKRSTTNGGPYAVIAGPAVANYTNLGLANGTTYYYVVSAVNTNGESADSGQVNATPSAVTLYEAENAVLSGPVVANNHSGYSGTGFADYINASVDYIEWTISAPFSGTYGLEFRYAQATSNRPLELKVNGSVVVPSLNFPATGAWNAWASVTTNAYLQAGNNTVRLTAIGSSGGNLDYLRRLGGVPPPPPVAGFAALPSTGVAPLTVAFTDSSTGSITNWHWDFGDGNTTNFAVSTNPAHAYGAGVFTVTQVVSGPGGASTNMQSNLLTVLTPLQQWQLDYFGCTNCAPAAANADPDGDGMSNTNEFLAGTNPTNSLSGLRILSVETQGDDVNLTWSTAGGRTNVVQVTAGDGAGGYATNFTNLSGLIIVTGSGDATTNYVDPDGATNTPSRYYRIRLVP